MTQQDDHEWIRQVYQDYLKNRIDRRELEEEKKSFIRDHFSPEPFFLFRPALAVPVLSVLVLSVVLWVMPPLKTPEEGPVVMPQPAAVAQPVEKDYQIHAVKVKRASSRAGTVMVYQKLYQDDPMTIVWVFPNV